MCRDGREPCGCTRGDGRRHTHIYYIMCCMTGNRPARMYGWPATGLHECCKECTHIRSSYICSNLLSKKVVRTCSTLKPLAMADEWKWKVYDADFRRTLTKRLRIIREHVLQELKQRYSARTTAFCVLMCVRSCLPASVF